MFLSKLRKSFLPAGLCMVITQGCGPSATNEAVPIPPIIERKSGFPFSIKEPEIYQGDIVINGRDKDRVLIARKGARWREDQFRDGELRHTELFTDKRYSIDHERKIYLENEPAPNGVDSFAGMPMDMFRHKEHYEFDDLGPEGTVNRYKVRSNKYMPDDILIDVDTASGVIVRQEFRSAAGSADNAVLVYEMRNLKLEVDDLMFALPAGYKKVTRDAFYKKPDK